MNADQSGSILRRFIRRMMLAIPDVLHAVRKPCINTSAGIVKETDTNDDQRMLSFCTTYRNRFAQITKTLPLNLEHNRADSAHIEFVVVQFGGEEDLLPWLKANHPADLDSGYLKFFSSNQMPNWHMSIAKNTAHNIATGKILTNLDCDNYTGEHGGRMVIETLCSQNQPSLFWQWAGERGDGTAGRISMARALFHAIGGYDENLGMTQQEDWDLINRLRSQGINVVELRDKQFSYAIKNELGMGLSSNQDEIKRLIRENRSKSLKNILSGRVIANSDRDIGVSANKI